ncbi:MAG TPA: bifunctional phosphopantothenoylcysteine decarboxylase/phosphopantothenate--cysteine ligase CoaBC [Bryobacteraceae bacterium]|nr:bifunctional phosphopantothenoylcysteine decarboxylase/phosphopantothenate--cysteine ligase CoaBC [Bryobacteraceae bacterium]
MHVVLGVGGGIAAYKAAELARSLMRQGFTVNPVLTRAAGEFITPLTFAALTGRKVVTDLFGDRSAEEVLASSVEHIQVAQENRVLVIAPATADLLAKFAHGLADDFLSTLYLAFTGPVVLAPAMNTNMWNHPATAANMETLRARGHRIVGPDAGDLACGTVGPGRLAELDQIVSAVSAAVLNKNDLSGEVVLVSAGPTQEPVDPVRYITNRSSGKMGYALAEAAAVRGARVILVSGPVHIPPPHDVQLTPVRTAQEMRDAIMEHLDESTIIIKSAAVADYRVANVAATKIKKTAARVSLDLDPTPDILAEVGSRKGDRLLIGFAAETNDMVAEARRKMQTKKADMIVGNFVNVAGTGFESDLNEVTLVMSTGETVPLARASKREIAHSILDHALRLRLALHASQ